MLIVGSHVSPYARKVHVALETKGIAYESDPITPFYGTDEFTRISPLRRIPVLIDGELVLNDSTVICEYLDEAYPDPPLMPKAPRDRARARWLEEYADSRLGDLIIWGLFFPKIVRPRTFGKEADPEALAQVTERDLPEALDWIEAQAPVDGFLFDRLCIADIAFGCFFRNAALAGWEIDAERWPRAAAWIARIWEAPAFAATMPLELATVTSRVADRRDALRAAGARISEHSYGAGTPHSSIMLGAIAQAD